MVGRGENGRSQFCKLLLLCAAVGGMCSLLCGCFTSAVWHDDSYNCGSCFGKVVDWEIVPNLERSELTLNVEVKYCTAFYVFPGYWGEPSSWNRLRLVLPRRTMRQSEVYSPADLAQCFGGYRIFVSESRDETPRDEPEKILRPTPRAVKLGNGLWCVEALPRRAPVVHPDDVPLLKSAPFFLVKKKGRFRAVGWAADDHPRYIPIDELIHERIKKICENHRLSKNWITAWKVLITPVNFLADVVCLPGEIFAYGSYLIIVGPKNIHIDG